MQILNQLLDSITVGPPQEFEEVQAFASLEMAVKEKTGDKKSSFKKQLDNLFSSRQFSSGFAPPVDLAKAISWLRNDLAHGSTTLHGQGLTLLRTCAGLINELFPKVQGT